MDSVSILFGTIYYIIGLCLLICQTASQNIEGDIRLQDGNNIYEGRIEIYHNNVWTTVCIHSFDLVDADVVCQQLFQENARAVVAGSLYGAGSSGESMLGIMCNVADSTLASCSNSGYSNSCDHSNDAGVKCQFPGYRGCHNNMVVPLLTGSLSTGREDLTISDCIEVCRSNQFAFSGTMEGTRCYCGNIIETSPGESTVAIESLCDVVCSGDSTQLCGGSDPYMSIYESSIGIGGGIFTMSEGYFYSPSFPSEYRYQASSRMWTVIYVNPTHTRVTISMLDLATGDYLVLTSALGLMETFMGSDTLSLPYVWETGFTNMFTLELSTISTSVGGGRFVISYEAVQGSCGGDFTETSGTIASPNYPNVASASSSCEYTIVASLGQLITLNIEHLNLPAGSSLIVNDGSVETSVSSAGMLPQSANNTVTIIFQTSSTTSSSAFLMSYTASQGPCHTTPTIPFGNLSPDDGSVLYPPQTLTLTCDNGYMADEDSISCMEDGSWTTAVCNVICAALPTIPFGSLATGGNAVFYPQATLSLTCDAGYMPSAMLITCADDGSWSTAQCDEILVELTTRIQTTVSETTEGAPTTPEETTTPIPIAATTNQQTTVAPTQEITHGITDSVVETTMPGGAITATELRTTEALATTSSGTQSPSAITTEPSGPGQCRVSSDPVMENLSMSEVGYTLALNVGNPLACNGYLTGVQIHCSNSTTVIVSILRYIQENEYTLVGRFNVVGNASMVVEVQLDENDWIKFENGDMIGTSSEGHSPLTYSDDLTDSVDYMIWDVSSTKFNQLAVGVTIDLTPTSVKPKRTYSLAAYISLSKSTCTVPDILNGIVISPTNTVYYIDDTIDVQCNDKFRPSEPITITCLADATFETIACERSSLNAQFIIIGIVCVGTIGVLVLIIIVVMACINEQKQVTNKPRKTSAYSSTGSGRSDNSQRFLIPIEDDGYKGRSVSYDNPAPTTDEIAEPVSDVQYPPVDYPLDDEREAIQAMDEAVLGFEGDNLSFESGPVDNRSMGEAPRPHVTFSDKR